MRKTLSTLAVTAAAASAMAVAAPAAHASSPYTPQGICGGGYYVVDSHQFDPPTNYATTYLLYNSGNGNNCVVTIANYPQNGSDWYQAQVQVGSQTRTDSGNFTYYAGPVYLYGRSQCVNWSGEASEMSWSSGWSHCR